MSLENIMDYYPGDSSKSALESQDIYKPVIEKKQISVALVRYEVEPHLREDLCETNTEVELYWDWVKKEWFAKVDGQWFQDYPKGRTLFPFTLGKENFRLNESACRKLLEAYNIPESKLAEYRIGSIMSVAKISPKKLARLSGK